MLCQLFVILIKAYKYLISPIKGECCIYEETCSDYAVSAFKKYKFYKAFYLSLKRILSCHPFKNF